MVLNSFQFRYKAKFWVTKKAVPFKLSSLFSLLLGLPFHSLTIDKVALMHYQGQLRE